MPTLTPRQKQILDFVKVFIKKNGMSPTFEEISRHTKKTFSTVHEHVEALIKKGFLSKINNSSRGIQLIDQSEMVKILLLGTVAAGQPIEAMQEKEVVAVAKNLLPRQGSFFALKVVGESMVDENINDGDYVIVKQQSVAENGQKVVALINNNEATLKKIYKEKNQIRLQPANKNFKPIIVKENQDFKIQGIVIDVIKNIQHTQPSVKIKKEVEIPKINTKYLDYNKIYSGRAEELMTKIEPSSIALSFWSPPYFVGKEYEKDETYESWQTMLKKIIELHATVLKPGGFMVINIADILCFADENIPKFQALNLQKQKSKVTKEMILETKALHPKYNRNELAKLLGCSEQTIDRRLNGNNIRGGKYQTQTRVKLVGGNLENFAYNAGLYLYDKRVWVKDPTWQNSKWTSNSLKAVSEYEDLYIFWKPGQQVINREKLSKAEWTEWGMRGLWYINSVRANKDHEAQFPTKLAERVVRLYSDPNDIILDPFIGGGTTAVAAINTNRRFIGIEKEKKYVELANSKLELIQKQAKLNLRLASL